MPGDEPSPSSTVSGAAIAAVTDSVASNPTAQTVGGTLAAATATPLGATGLTLGQGAAFATVASITTGAPEVAGLSWIVTLLFQGIKHLKWVDQDSHKWFILPALSFLVGFWTWLLFSHGDLWIAGAKGAENSGIMSASAMANYHSARPLGWFNSALDRVAAVVTGG